MAAAGPAAGAQLEDLTEQDQRRDGGGGFEVDVGLAAHAAECWRKDLREDGRDEAVEVGDARAHRDQREHVGGAVDDGGPAALEERPSAPENHRRGERKFDPG